MVDLNELLQATLWVRRTYIQYTDTDSCYGPSKRNWRRQLEGD